VVTTFASICTGGGGADWGARAAGRELAWGIELDPRIAEVANHNLGPHVVTGDILDMDPRRFEPVDALHASPPCPNFSAAKVRGLETALDIALARKVAEFVAVLQPRVFTLENVPMYRKSKSWALIQRALYKHGYWLHMDILNAADFGVPQTRRRLVVRAVKGGFVPYLPTKTPWCGWYDAIADLIPDLPESQFAKWQLERLPEAIATMLVSGGGHYLNLSDKRVATFAPDQPAMTVLTGTAGRARAFIESADEPGTFLHMTGATSSHPETRGTGVLEPDAPANTVTPNSAKARAFIVHATDQRTMPVRDAAEPMFTCLAGKGRALNMPRAYLVDGANASHATGEPTVRRLSQPAFTITAGGNRVNHRALLNGGRIVKMTPRALARFQSFPDSYELPDKSALAFRIVGNACPPKLFEQLYRGLA
jgi:DNA-cytosine methyltransferase